MTFKMSEPQGVPTYKYDNVGTARGSDLQLLWKARALSRER